MKQIIFILCLILIALFSFSQDIIISRSGTEIKAKVVEITSSEIKYRKWENQDGPIYSINVTSTFMVKYANGQSDFFGDKQPINTQPVTPAPAQPTTQTRSKSSNNKSTHSILSEEKENALQRKYRGQIGGGAAMLALGLPCLGAGIGLTASGAAIAADWDYYTATGEDGSALWITGAVVLAAGIAFTIAGPIQISKGIHNKIAWKKATQAYFDFKPVNYANSHFTSITSKTIAGLAIHF